MSGMIIAGLLDSVIRNRNNVKIFFIMNAVQDIELCPLFSFFGLTLPYGKDIKLFKDNMVLVQYMKNLEFRKERGQTLIGKLMNDTPYYEYAIDNQIIGRNSDFIEKKSGSARFVFAIVYKGETYGIWNDYSKGKVFISSDYLRETRFIFAISKEDNKPNVMMLRALKQYQFWKNFEQNYIYGNVYFESQKVKVMTQEFTKIIRAF